MPKTIVAIGGGQIRTRATLAIDREIIRLSNKKNPRLLFIPTARSDSEIYCKRVRKYFGDFLKCQIDALLLIKETPSKGQIREQNLVSGYHLRRRRKHPANDAHLAATGSRQTSDRSLHERNGTRWHQRRLHLLV